MLIIIVQPEVFSQAYAEDKPDPYCLSAGPENNFDCNKTGLGSRQNRGEIQSKVMQLQRWLDEEKTVGRSLVLHRKEKELLDNVLQQKIDLNSQILDREVLRAKRIYSDGEYSKAFNLISAYISEKSTDPDGWLTYGSFLMDQGRLTEAENVFVKLSQIYPDLPEPYNNLAVIHSERGDSDLAIEQLLKAFSVHPSYSQIQINLKEVYSSLAKQVQNRLSGLSIEESQIRPELSVLDQVFDKSDVEGNFIFISPETGLIYDFIPDKDRFSSSGTETGGHDNTPKLYLSAELMAGLTHRVREWSKFRLSKNIEAYRDIYIAEYHPPEFDTHQRWVEAIQNQMAKNRAIVSQTSKFFFKPVSEKRINVVFQHSFGSADQPESVFRLLGFILTSDGWKVYKEAVL